MRTDRKEPLPTEDEAPLAYVPINGAVYKNLYREYVDRLMPINIIPKLGW